MALGGGPVAGGQEILQAGKVDEGRALQENEDGDQGQGADGREGQEKQDPLDEFALLHYLTPTSPSFSRICWPWGLRTKSTNFLQVPVGASRLTSRKRRRNL